MTRSSLLVLLSALGLLVGCSAAPQQITSCKSYIACYETTGGTKGSLDTTYGVSGSCWSTTPEAASACEKTCKSGFDALVMAHPDAGCV